MESESMQNRNGCFALLMPRLRAVALPALGVLNTRTGTDPWPSNRLATASVSSWEPSSTTTTSYVG